MHWEKLGIVYAPDERAPWAVSHAMVPTPFLLNDNTIRVFVTLCDANFVGRPVYVDVDARDPKKILGVGPGPLMDIGVPSAFDDNGVLTCSVTRLDDGRIFMYYAGFELGVKVRYKLLTGLAVSSDNGERFERVQQTPVLERSDSEMTFRGGPFVFREDGVFKLWYVAGSGWEMIDGKPMPVYVLKYAESSDGVQWPKEGRTVLDLTGSDEHGFGRPWITKSANGKYQLYYSIRRRSLRAYRLGYAESDDGIHWLRKDDEMGLDVTPGSFDSDAIMYSAVINVHGQTYCFYNGNEFGRDGFAVARLTSAQISA
ncbi:hypothetical protein [Paraburkholderia unamae]|uniref:Glycosyl hydrolase family 32 n=1 Tax=Paraburkholderia unamae TaxID=219649 RepID=A0ABX5KM22_9BURK|nr:hypothetical protein [Paraburkholderia unamae]PVX82302.1 hypothetical protein C7402_109155 [Paraburkholderia unamae]